MVRISAEPIDPAKVYGQIAKNSTGSVVFHYAVVKQVEGAGGTTDFIDYTASDATEAELEGISRKLSAEFSIEDVLLIRRVGRVGLGEIISLVAASSASSEEAFEACKQGVSRLKKMGTIVKNEVCR
jgi:molybdopterin synthase catalytic subunit